jgi:predicted permease
MRRQHLVARLHRLSLYLFPRAFRTRFGDEVHDAFTHGLSARQTRGARVRYLAGALLDVPRSAAAEWWRSRPTWQRIGDGLWQDVRDGRRAITGQAGATAAVVVTLALGVGANAAIFRLADAVLLRPLPIAQPERVVALFHVPAGATEAAYYGLGNGLSYSAFRALESGTTPDTPMTGIAGFIDVEVGLHDDSGARQLTAGAVSGGYFSILGLRAAAGRLIEPADDVRGGAARVAVLSDALWARDYGRRYNAVGQTLTLGGTTFTIVGIAPRGFRGTRLSARPDLWVPMTTLLDLRAGGIWNGPLGQRMLGDHPLGWVRTIGRLRDDVTPTQASEDLRSRLGPPQSDRILDARPIVEAAALGDRDGLLRFVTMLWIVVGLTLLVACLNVANLLYVRSSGRIRELAMRAALGASRGRLIRQLLVEHVGLAALSAVGAAGIAILTLRLLATFTLPGNIAIDELGLGAMPDVQTAIGVAVVALLTALAAGVGPAVRASSQTSASWLRAHGTAHRRGPRRALIAGQVAATVVLLVGALLFVRSLRAGLQTDLGFEPNRLSAVSVDLFRYGYDVRRARAYYDDAALRGSGLPGVQAVALATHVPLSPLVLLPLTAPDGLRRQDDMLVAGFSSVTWNYFDVMGIRMLEGRTFQATDVSSGSLVAVVSESAARGLFGSAPGVLGREIHLFDERRLTVIGVVADVKTTSVRDQDVPMVYQHFAQETPTGGVSLVARSLAPAATLAALRQTLRTVDATVAPYNERLVSDQIADALSTQRFGSVLLSLFAVVALTVAAVGIAGVVAYTTNERAMELGVRRALGAGAGHLVRVVTGSAGVGVAAGLCLGLAAAAILSRTLERFLFGVATHDWPSYLATILIIGAAAGAALLTPARRSLRTDPLVAMRHE